jgi:anti-sigma regulatory factor (Ser/Thr protein kinase)
MNDGDAIDLAITSDPANLPTIRQTLRDWTQRNGWSEHDIGQIVLAVDEALANCIRHGYDRECHHQILLHVRPVDDPQHGVGMEIRIRDFGHQVEPSQICGRALDDVRPGGLGVHIIRCVMDTAEYSRAENCGMQLVMRKYRRAATGGAEGASDASG